MNIGECKASLPRKARGANLDDIQGIEDFTVFKEAADVLLLEIDPIRTVRRQPFMLYPGVHEYATWSDLKGKKVISIQPQSASRGRTPFHQEYADDVDKEDSLAFGISFDNGQKFMRIEHDLGGAAVVDETATTTDWTAGGVLTNLEEDSLVIEGALRFDLANGSNLLTAAIDTIDLTEEEGQGAFFREIYLSDASKVSAIKLRIGNSAGSYWELTGARQQGGNLVNGINLIKFDWSGIGAGTGAPAAATVDYERMEFTATATLADVRMGPLMVGLPRPYIGAYYSNCLFLGTTGTWKEAPTEEDDEILLESEEESAYLYQVAEIIADDMQRTDRAANYNRKLHGDGNEQGAYSSIKNQKPGESKRTVNRFYKIRTHHARPSSGTKMRDD